VTKKLRVQKVTKRVSKAVLERRQWRKFGGSEKLKPGESDQGVTAVSVEEIFLERVRVQSKSEVEKLTDPLAAMAASNASLLVCRICGKKGDHWTSKCPYKDLAASKGLTVGEKLDESGDVRKGAGGYVPPSMRSGAKGGESMGDSMRKPRDENSIRVTNLSEDTREQDLQELFRPFGPVTRIYVAFNRETGESRGFAFINFVNRDDAPRALNKLDGRAPRATLCLSLTCRSHPATATTRSSSAANGLRRERKRPPRRAEPALAWPLGSDGRAGWRLVQHSCGRCDYVVLATVGRQYTQHHGRCPLPPKQDLGCVVDDVDVLSMVIFSLTTTAARGS
jgi:translation initiation factor 3 subunit G